MTEFIKRELSRYGSDLFGYVPIDRCHISRPYKLRAFEGTDPSRLGVIIIAIPYYSHIGSLNISRYAAARDYHAFCDGLFDDLIPKLAEKFSPYRFCGFADNSPIFERDAAALAGLGVIGDNRMLITEKYSSYVFLAEIITDYPIPISDTYEIKYCEHCGKCQSACPMVEVGECLSAITQKKGQLCENERAAILKYGSAWGCDICQDVCPHTQSAIGSGSIYTPVKFFTENLTPKLTTQSLQDMSDEEFSHRAYSWRGREVIMRNLKLFEEQDD